MEYILVIGLVLYLSGAFLVFPLSKRFPKHFGPAKKIFKFFCLSYIAGSISGWFFFIYLAIWLMWPAIFILSMLIPTLTLKAPANSPQSVCSKSVTPSPGSKAICESDLKPVGKVKVDGHLYDAISRKGFVTKGSGVEIVRQQGFYLIVKQT